MLDEFEDATWPAPAKPAVSGIGIETNANKGTALRASIDRGGRRWRHAAWLGPATALAMGSVGSLAADDLRHSPTARAFAQMLPLTLDMPDLNDNEKHVRLPHSLPTNAVRPGTIRTGDVMLYGSDTLVVFYKTFPSSYSDT